MRSVPFLLALPSAPPPGSWSEQPSKTLAARAAPGRRPFITASLVDHRLFRSGPGQRPYGQLVIALRAVRLLADQGTQVAAEEAERNRDQPGVAQREPREVHAGEQGGRRAGDNRGEGDQEDGHEQSPVDAENRAPSVEPPPEQVVEQGRQVRGRSDRESQSHQEGDVQPLRRNSEQNRDGTDDERRNPGDAQLTLLACLTLLE